MISNQNFIFKLDAELEEMTGIKDVYEKYCGYLTLEDLFTTDSVYMAACHCAIGFMDRKDTSFFMDSAWIYSRELAQKVLNGKFKPSYYRQQTIVERGKPRVIRPPKFECKVVQKVLCDYLLRTMLEPRMIHTNYASIRGRGTAQMYADVLKAVNKYGHSGSVIVMTDFSGYFASIDHDILKSRLGKYIKDTKVLDLYMSFCDNDQGLALGNEASQIPASWFPSLIDHELKDHCGLHSYFRFMDDILLLAEDETEADEYLAIINHESSQLGLKLKETKIQKVSYGKPFIFCKERFIFNKEDQYYYRHMNPQTERNEMRKLRKFDEKYHAGKMTKESIDMQVRGVLGCINSKPNTRKSVQRIEKRYEAIFANDSQKESVKNV